MAISVGTDLVLDVLNAGDPKRAAIADANLQTKSTSSFEVAAAGEKFAAELASKLTDAGTTDAPFKNLADLRAQFIKPEVGESFKKFEAVILEQFVKNMLPEDASAVFGEGTAGDIWKGMMAQQIGETIAKSGGIGIAQELQNRADSSGRSAQIVQSNERTILDALDENSSR